MAGLVLAVPLLLGWRWHHHSHRTSAASKAAAAPGVFVTPKDGHRPVIAAIDAAERGVQMEMFHLTDPSVVKALLRARERGVDVRVILDGASLQGKKYSAAAKKLEKGGVDVRGSSPAFSITHVKAMVVDGARTFVMSVNLTQGASRTRDFGVVTDDPGVAAEVAAVFEADWANAKSGAGDTPPVSRPDLLWSPVDSAPKLVALIGSARRELTVTVENLGAPEIEAALGAAAGRGVRVRVLVPMCDLNKDPLWNYPSLARLAAAGAQTRVMPYPASPKQPYMHAKTMTVDGARAYVGSENYSVNSLHHARELGILLSQPAEVRVVVSTFETDWAKAVPPPNPLPSFCPAGD